MKRNKPAPKRMKEIAVGIPDGVREQYLNDRETAEFFGISVKTIQLWRFLGVGPPVTKLSSRTVRYRLGAVLDWAKAKELSTGASKEK